MVFMQQSAQDLQGRDEQGPVRIHKPDSVHDRPVAVGCIVETPLFIEGFEYVTDFEFQIP